MPDQQYSLNTPVSGRWSVVIDQIGSTNLDNGKASMPIIMMVCDALGALADRQPSAGSPSFVQDMSRIKLLSVDPDARIIRAQTKQS